MKCPKCNSKNVDKTCSYFSKNKPTIWNGYFCYDCGHWWPKNQCIDNIPIQLRRKVKKNDRD